VPERNSNIQKKPAAAATDLLRRRVALPYSFRFVLRESLVRIRTNSALMSRVCQSLEARSFLASKEANVEWEITVETLEEIEAVDVAEPETSLFEVHRFGPSCAVRMANGSWFAHTPPSLNGVGFAMVNGTERDQIHQLSAYLRAIVNLVEQSGARSIAVLALEVSG
jgi:hypothetical protein